MLVSGSAIGQLVESGMVRIETFNRNQLNPNSYDVRLGEWFYIPKRWPLLRDIDPTLEADIKMLYGNPIKCSDYVTVPAGSTILAHTQEFIGSTAGYVWSMRARSSIGRMGLTVCKDAGLGDVGYSSRWTMEISNLMSYPIRLYVGQRVAQMELHEVKQALGHNTEYHGKYGLYRDKESWNPNDMLPKLYKDWELVAAAISGPQGIEKYENSSEAFLRFRQ